MQHEPFPKYKFVDSNAQDSHRSNTFSAQADTVPARRKKLKRATLSRRPVQPPPSPYCIRPTGDIGCPETSSWAPGCWNTSNSWGRKVRRSIRRMQRRTSKPTTTAKDGKCGAARVRMPSRTPREQSSSTYVLIEKRIGRLILEPTWNASSSSSFSLSLSKIRVLNISFRRICLYT